MPGLAVAVSYNRRSYEELIWTDNLAISHSDYTLLTTPDPRGNGELLPVYNLDRAKLGLVNELDTNSNLNTRVYNGFDVSFNYRLRERRNHLWRHVDRTCDRRDLSRSTIPTTCGSASRATTTFPCRRSSSWPAAIRCRGISA